MFRYLAIVAITVATPSAAQISFDNPPPIPRPASDSGLDRMVCKVEDTVGSRLKKHRVCATVREWQEAARDNQDAVVETQLRNQALPCDPAMPNCI